MNRIVFFLLMLLVCQFSVGQVVKKTVVAKEVQPITYKSSWGPINSGNALIAQINAIAPAAIMVKDNSGVFYPVLSFRINYLFKGSYRDDETQEVKIVNDLRVGDFYDTAQLPTVWVESIQQNIKSGDVILFSKIMFRNKAGKLQLAPELKIIAE